MELLIGFVFIITLVMIVVLFRHDFDDNNEHPKE